MNFHFLIHEPNKQDAQPRTIIALWKANLHAPIYIMRATTKISNLFKVHKP